LALKREGITYYIHAWQSLLMFLAGSLSVLAACAGYLQSGGGEELLRRTLANLQTGAAQFDDIDFRQWRNGKMIVRNFRHSDFDWPRQSPIARFSGLEAREVDVQMDLLPWPPNVQSITVRGMPHASLKLEDGFLQSGIVQDLKVQDIPVICFEDCDLELQLGELAPLRLSGCSGELRRKAHPLTDSADGLLPRKNRLHGQFSLSKLNGKPFNLRLESLEDGRWVLTGGEIELNTADTLKTSHSFFTGKIDPVALLVRALFSGEMGVKGALSSLRIGVQPAEDMGSFNCAGEVGYKNLELQLPAPGREAARVPLFLLDQLWGVTEAHDEGFLPRWMLLDHIRTGSKGRVAFHMAGGVLNFACDEGPGSALTGMLGTHEYPALESLKGSLETDADGHARRMVLRGSLGGPQPLETATEQPQSGFDFETRIERQQDRSRNYELVLEPRASDPGGAAFGQPLWRFVSKVTDYLAVQKTAAENEETVLAKFQLEMDARRFPLGAWLPPCFSALCGRLSLEGRLSWEHGGKYKLLLSSLSLNDGAALAYEGPPPSAKELKTAPPLGIAAGAIFASSQPWQLQNLALQGEVEVEFEPELRATLKNCCLTSGLLIHAGLVTDLGQQHPQLQGLYHQDEKSSALALTASLMNLPLLKFEGQWPSAGPPAGNFFLREKNVPLSLHPQREELDKRFINTLDYGVKQYVNRTTSVKINADGSLKTETEP
jgi:hypothetical protein